jgi:hypothetical protein
MSTTVSYLRRDVVIAQTVLDGRLLPIQLPTSVTASYGTGQVELVEVDDPTLECCGRLTLVTYDEDGEMAVSHLDVPPPPPFSKADLLDMWTARNRLDVARRPPTSGDADWSAVLLSPAFQIRLSMMPSALASARDLLRRWPARPAITHRTMPIERRGGRVDLLQTARARHRRPGVAIGDRTVPGETVRVFGERRHTKCGSVAAIADLLRHRANAVLAVPAAIPSEADRRAVLAPLGGVSEMAAVPRGRVDGPPSTWPHALQTFYSRAATALAEVEVVGAGDDSAPLSELWELFQSWVAERTLALMTDILGPPKPVAKSSCLGRWTHGAEIIELHCEPTIPAGPGQFIAICGVPVHAVVGDLRPDVLIAVRTSQGGPQMLAVDPKKRPHLDSETLTTEASKYLWGIRSSGAVCGVVLVAPSGGVSSKRTAGLAWTVQARPRVWDLQEATVANWLQFLRASAAAAGP